MLAITTQLRVTIPVELQRYLELKAGKFGLSMSSYVKNLIINDVKDTEYLNTKTALLDIQQSEREFEAGQAKVLTSLADI